MAKLMEILNPDQHFIYLFFFQVVQKLCAYHRLWREGKTAQIQQEISSTPRTKLPQCVKKKTEPSESESDDDDDEGQERGAQALCNGHHEVTITIIQFSCRAIPIKCF